MFSGTRKLAVIVLLCTIALFACGDDGNGDDAGGNGDGGGDFEGAAFCQQATEVDARFNELEESEELIPDVATMEEALALIRELDPPAEIEADMEVTIEGLEIFIDAFADIDIENLDPTDPEAFAGVEEALADFDEERFEEASDNIEAYLETECGIDTGGDDDTGDDSGTDDTGTEEEGE